MVSLREAVEATLHGRDERLVAKCEQQEGDFYRAQQLKAAHTGVLR